MEKVGTPDTVNEETPDKEKKEMTFLDHLEEFRWSILKALIALLIATSVCGYFAEYIVQEILLKPLSDVGLKSQVLSPYGIIVLYMQTVLVCGFIISMPSTLYFVWKFVAPGLLKKERMYISKIVFYTSICFFSGVAFAYFILLPTALTFFSAFGTSNIDLNIAIDRYVSFVLVMLLGAGLVFELPMAAYFLSKMGLLTPAFMRHYRKHAIIAILIVAAIITPTPDVVTQLLLAAPLMVLYELSIFISYMAQPKPFEESA